MKGWIPPRNKAITIRYENFNNLTGKWYCITWTRGDGFICYYRIPA